MRAPVELCLCKGTLTVLHLYEKPGRHPSKKGLVLSRSMLKNYVIEILALAVVLCLGKGSPA